MNQLDQFRIFTPFEKVEDSSLQQTVKEMQDHFAKTGVFRSADLNKVIGDPRTSVGYEIVNGLCASARVSK